MDEKDYLRGSQLYQLNRYEDAIKYFNQALEGNPTNLDAKFYLVLCHLELKNLEKAKELAYGLLEEEADNPNVHYIISRIHYIEEDFINAYNHINIAIEVNPYEADFFGHKASMLLFQKKYDEGVQTVNVGLQIDPNNEFCLNIKVQLLTKLGKKEEATHTVENILDINPDNVYSHSNVGWVELENGNHKKALDHFKEALRLNPNFEHARDGMSTALKAKNIFYKNYLKYSFWIGKKSSNQQWIFIIGLYVAYRFLVEIVSATNMTYLIIPLVVLYLFFVLGTWIMEPISNAILMNDRYGKYLLDEDDKRSGLSFSILFFISLVSIITYFILDNDYFLTLALASFVALIPIPRAFIISGNNQKLLGFGIGAIMILLGTLGFLIPESSIDLNLTIIITLVAYTWISNFVK